MRTIFSLNIIHFILFTAVLNFSSHLHAEQVNPKLGKYLNELETFSAAFEQRLFNGSGEELEKSVGVFYLRRPGMFHWAYWEPYSQMIISDGITLWVYDEDLEQVIIKDVGDSISGSPAAILGGEININEHFVIINMGVIDGTDWIELTPRDVDSQYSSIKLGFEHEKLAKMVLFDNLGQQNIITFLDIKLNTSLDINLFQFSPPDDIDIIDSRE